MIGLSVLAASGIDLPWRTCLYTGVEMSKNSAANSDMKTNTFTTGVQRNF